MEQTANRHILFYEIIVEFDAAFGVGDNRFNAPFLEAGNNFGRHIEPGEDTPGQHDDGAAVFDKFDNITRLNAGGMIRAGFSPVPGASTPRPEFEIFALANDFNFHFSPAGGKNAWGDMC